VRIPYPNGDVRPGRGGCTDVVIGTYRVLGIDLQKEVHEDMTANFAVYPKDFGLRRPDRNMDHRRVPNWRKFFERHGQTLPITREASDTRPGDTVTGDLETGQQHIGIVSDRRASLFGSRRKIGHNIGAGQVLGDVLFDWPITGHYRFFRGIRRENRP
jgi:uncharacterized protein YijF (DUF1287 family)